MESQKTMQAVGGARGRLGRVSRLHNTNWKEWGQARKTAACTGIYEPYADRYIPEDLW